MLAASNGADIICTHPHFTTFLPTKALEFYPHSPPTSAVPSIPALSATMATILKHPPFSAPLSPCNTISSKLPKPSFVSYRRRTNAVVIAKLSPTTSLRFSTKLPLRLVKLVPLSSQGEADTTQTEQQQQVEEQEIEDSSDGAVGVEDANEESEVGLEDTSSGEEGSDVEETPSTITSLLQSYKEALTSKEESKIAEIEAFFKSIDDAKNDLESKVATLTEEMSVEKDRVLRISADFDNFRKRTERERLSLVTNSQGEVVERLLPVLDNFERAQAQIKAETEAEEKIKNSYQSIYKQFMEILSSLGVVPVEPIGNPFDPLLHEAIMREDSTECEEGIIIEEFRKGFKLGDRLLRPSMVKVSAGPGPAKCEQTEASQRAETAVETDEATGKTSEEGTTEAESA